MADRPGWTFIFNRHARTVPLFDMGNGDDDEDDGYGYPPVKMPAKAVEMFGYNTMTDPRALPAPATVIECEQWVEAVLRMPQGALAYLYRMLRDGRGLNVDTIKRLEAEWRAKK